MTRISFALSMALCAAAFSSWSLSAHAQAELCIIDTDCELNGTTCGTDVCSWCATPGAGCMTMMAMTHTCVPSNTGDPGWCDGASQPLADATCKCNSSGITCNLTTHHCTSQKPGDAGPPPPPDAGSIQGGSSSGGGGSSSAGSSSSSGGIGASSSGSVGSGTSSSSGAATSSASGSASSNGAGSNASSSSSSGGSASGPASSPPSGGCNATPGSASSGLMGVGALGLALLLRRALERRRNG